jgi:hypothetical protein
MLSFLRLVLVRAECTTLNPIVIIFTSKSLNVLGSSEVNMMDWTSRAALEYICQAGLGYSFSSLDPNSTNEYANAMKMLR